MPSEYLHAKILGSGLPEELTEFGGTDVKVLLNRSVQREEDDEISFLCTTLSGRPKRLRVPSAHLEVGKNDQARFIRGISDAEDRLMAPSKKPSTFRRASAGTRFPHAGYGFT